MLCMVLVRSQEKEGSPPEAHLITVINRIRVSVSYWRAAHLRQSFSQREMTHSKGNPIAVAEPQSCCDDPSNIPGTELHPLVIAIPVSATGEDTLLPFATILRTSPSSVPGSSDSPGGASLSWVTLCQGSHTRSREQRAIPSNRLR